MNQDELKGNPFFLDNEACAWVQKTLGNMSLEEKIGQVFCPAGKGINDSLAEYAVADLGVGGIMTMPGKAADVQAFLRHITGKCKIPLLCAANLESGGGGLVQEGTYYGDPMMLSAGGNPEAGYRLGKICAREASLIGCNWAFAPVVDLDLNYRNAVVALRSFGRDPNTVIRMAGGYLKAAKEEHIAVALKHFPGDGVDEWDHHYEPSTNSLPFEEWESSYGRIYRTLFTQGALTVMVGHISLPSYAKAVSPEEDEYAPATLSPALLQKLLRQHLGFRGMVVTDSTNMLAFLCYMPRRKAIPTAISAGCDMILFNKNLDEDMAFLREGLKQGLVTEGRLNEAVSRILAVKAALGLHKGQAIPDPDTLHRLGDPEHNIWAMQAAENAITLVKDTQSMLPLTPEKYPRLYLNVLQEGDDPNTPLRQEIKAAFEHEGFRVFLRDRSKNTDLLSSLEENDGGVALMTNHYDAAVYVSKYNWDNELAIHLSWRGFHARGNDAPWFVAELPTMFMSLGHPYHLTDVPMIRTFINTFGKTAHTLPALMDRITGRKPFTGTSPTDPSCGRPEAMR
jgi:beta-N-acetylhexosaminidase